MDSKPTRTSFTTMQCKILPLLLLAVLSFTVFFSPVAVSAATNVNGGMVGTRDNPVVFEDKIINGEIPTYIDGDKVDMSLIMNPFFRDGGGSQYISSQYIRNQTIGNIFNWTSASSVTKSNGFDISSTFTATVYSMQMSINIGWDTSTSYTWTKDKGYSQFKVVGIGDVRVAKYYNLRTSSYYYVKTTINQEDIKLQR